MGSAIFGMNTARRSRAFNDVESSAAFNRIGTRYDNAKSKADERAGKSYLKHFRKLVAKHNTKNHAGQIAITAGMGACGVTIDGVGLSYDPRWNGFNQRRDTTPLMQLLFAIDEALDYDWAYTLDGEVLN
jgi:hypothetical protein